jgi:hypothetical protein
MVRRTILLLLLLITAGLYWWKTYTDNSGFSNADLSLPVHRFDASSPPFSNGAANLNLRQIKEQRLITYRIKPDRRFLLALDEIRHFGNPGAISLPPPRFENGRWLITTKKGAAIEFA